MKKSISILLAILLIFSISACSVQKEPVKESEENTVSQTEQSTENVLEFNRDTYEKSIQVNQKELHWATYNDLPSEIIIERDELIADTPWIIKTPAWEKYEFDQLKKVEVNGENACSVFKYLEENSPVEEIHGLKNKMAMKAVSKMSSTCKKKNDIVWNFTKFLVDKDGKVVKRLSPIESPMLLEDTIKELLK